MEEVCAFLKIASQVVRFYSNLMRYLFWWWNKQEHLQCKCRQKINI